MNPAAIENWTKQLQVLRGIGLDVTTDHVNQLIAPFYVVLPFDLKHQVKDFLHQLNHYVALKHYGGFSCACDFHYIPESQELKLIEINTNAAFLGLSCELYKAHHLDSDLKPTDLIEQFLFWTKPENDQECAIVDQQPQNQKLFVEFLWFQSLFKEKFQNVTIKDISEVTGQESAIYNRWTDFFLRNPDSRPLLQLWEKHPNRLTPNPRDYLNLADKTLFIRWQNKPDLKKFIPHTEMLTEKNANEMWAKRKNLFFKPANSFGSKAVYKGESISHSLFHRLVEESKSVPILAQERVPAPILNHPQYGNLKFDLRFYFFKTQVIQVVARFYQGQVTNLTSVGSGFAPVAWE